METDTLLKQFNLKILVKNKCGKKIGVSMIVSNYFNVGMSLDVCKRISFQVDMITVTTEFNTFTPVRINFYLPLRSKVNEKNQTFSANHVETFWLISVRGFFFNYCYV